MISLQYSINDILRSLLSIAAEHIGEPMKEDRLSVITKDMQEWLRVNCPVCRFRVVLSLDNKTQSICIEDLIILD